ncbi:hypothetical protein C8T65DRAFT_665885 [Cerioporus squamosus]|nr:hypothetical protein C8T65DRAFT_665885 [Cerioporus squamosus]
MMRSAKKKFASFLSLLLHRKRPAQTPPTSREVESLEVVPTPQPCRKPPPTFLALNVDVVHEIALVLREERETTALAALASCSRALRRTLSPVLFYHARYFAEYSENDPPEPIRHLVRRLKVKLRMENSAAVQLFISILGRLPNIVAIVFDAAFCTPIDVIKFSLAHPQITTIAFDCNANTFTAYEPPIALNMITSAPIPLTSFSYVTLLWREQCFELGRVRSEKLFLREEKWLSALVPKMANTIQQLTVPMETSPILAMANLSWPALQELSISGRYFTEQQKEALPLFLSSIPRLRKLSVTICRCGPTARPPILGSAATCRTTIVGLRSLTVAYPNPDDSIFAIDATHLSHLSLRDAPRFYHDCARRPIVSSEFARPILRSAECSYILRRMDMPQLSSLELVYLADTAGCDDELLTYVTQTFPHLSHLELHRYRANREEVVDYVNIAKLLTAARGLRSIRLNLDFHDDQGPYCGRGFDYSIWRSTFMEHRGPEIVQILEACPWLEYVELLYHAYNGSRWTKFRTSRYAGPRIVDPDDGSTVDSELLPYRL